MVVIYNNCKISTDSHLITHKDLSIVTYTNYDIVNTISELPTSISYGHDMVRRIYKLNSSGESGFFSNNSERISSHTIPKSCAQ